MKSNFPRLVSRTSSIFIALLIFFSQSSLSQPVFAQGNSGNNPPPGVRGQAAIEQLGARLPDVAAQYNLAPSTLRSLFLSDSNLWLDAQDTLVFIDEFLPDPAEIAAAAPTLEAGPVPYEQTFLLHSLPGATKVIYLDFDGHTTSNTLWNSNFNGGNDIVSAPFDLDGNPSGWSTAELDRIQYIWQRVAEDFLPYNVDVTTQDPGVEALRNSGGGDNLYGQRVVISPSNWYSTSAGGVAYVGAYTWNSDTPCYVFTAQLGGGNEKYTAEAASHEAGHTLGLYHDGVSGGASYYQGHANWAPIMGVGYYRDLVQWSKGEYATANNLEDDLAKMTTYGIAYRADDHGNSIGSATPLVITNATVASGSGIIEQTTDQDVFSFQSGAGTITFNIDAGPRSPNLDIQANLLDATGALVTSSNLSTLSTSFNATVTAGTYYLVIDGVGTGDPTTGYSDYASLGAFTVNGTIVDPGTMQPPVAVVSANPTSGNAPLLVNFSSSGSYDPDGVISSYLWDFGDGTQSTEATPTHTYNTEGTFSVILTITDDDGLIDTADLVITVTAPPSAPTGLSANAVSESQIDLVWTDTAGTESGFKIERSLDGSTWSQITTVGANSTGFNDTGLSASTAYSYRVSAYNAYGDSAYSNIATATTLDPPPFIEQLATSDLFGAGNVAGSYQQTHANDGAIESIQEIASGGKPSNRYSYLEHTWTFSVSPGLAVTFYANAWATVSADGDSFEFLYSTDNNSFTPMFTVVANADDNSYQTYALPTNVAGTLYIRVRDTNRVQGQNAPDTVFVDHLYIRSENVAVDPPAAPTNLTAATASSSEINLSWQDNSTNELSFQLERSSPDNTNWISVATIGNQEGTGTISYTDSGLAPLTTYYYRVQASNSGGASDYTNEANAQTDQGSNITLSLSGEKVKGEQIVTVSWSGAATNVDIYRDGALISANTANDGTATENLGKGGGTYTYLVCEAGTTTCSDPATISF